MHATYPQTPGLSAVLQSGVLQVTITNEARRNALDDEAVLAFIEVAELAQRDENVRAVLVAGAGGNFCSGFDIVARNAGEGERPRVGAIQRRLPVQAHRLIPSLLELQVPVVAAVRGYAVGIGFQLALVSDFVVTCQSATFWEPFSRRGMTPDGGAAWLLPRIVGPLRARQLLMLGRRLDGAEAQQWGIAHACVAEEAVDGEASRLARELADGATVALGLTKWLLNTGLDQPLKDHLQNEAFAMELGSRSPDFREGLAAFVGKRDPKFTGR